MKFKKLVLSTLILIASLSTKVQAQSIPDYFGEKIGYTLKAGFFTVGRVDIEFRGDTSGCGAYLLMDAKTTGVVNFLKDVHYRFDACVDTSTGYTIHSTRKVKEGSYTDYDEVFYNRVVLNDSILIVTEDQDSIIVQQDIYDILFAFFYFRKNHIHRHLKVDSVTHINTFFVDEEWDLNIKYAGKEKVETKLGDANCYKFLPETQIGRYFKTTEDMSMWVTNNKYLIPVLIQAKLKVATLTAEIDSYQRPEKFRTKKK